MCCFRLSVLFNDLSYVLEPSYAPFAITSLFAIACYESVESLSLDADTTWITQLGLFVLS